MRIALVTDTFRPEVNGVTTVLSVLHRGLAARGHEVLVVAPEYPPGAAPEPSVLRRPSVACPGYPAVRLSWPGRAVGRVLAAFQPELLHVITEGPLGWEGRRFALAAGIPLFTSFHTDFPRYAERYLGGWAVAPARRYLRCFHAPAVLTQTPSAETCGELRALGVPRAVVWGRGVDSQLFNPARRSRERRARLGVNGTGVVVLHVGRLAREKDPDTLIGALSSVRDRLGDEARFVVAGEGPAGAEVRQRLPFAKHLGFIDRNTVLPDLYADADIFVFPSPTETCGLVALEAMAAGLPVVAADRGGVLENLRHGINGLLAPAGDARGFAGAIVRLAEDPAQRSAMSQAARAFAVARDWARELDEYEAMARESVGEPRLEHAVLSPGRSLR